MSSIAEDYWVTPEILESGGSADADTSSRIVLSQSVIEAPSFGIAGWEHPALSEYNALPLNVNQKWERARHKTGDWIMAD